MLWSEYAPDVYGKNCSEIKKKENGLLSKSLFSRLTYYERICGIIFIDQAGVPPPTMLRMQRKP